MMTESNHLDRKLRDAFKSDDPIAVETIERIRLRVDSHFDSLGQQPQTKVRRPTVRIKRISALAFGSLALVASLAVAGPVSEFLFGDSPADSANQVSEFRDSPGNTSVGISVFEGDKNLDPVPAAASEALRNWLDSRSREYGDIEISYVRLLADVNTGDSAAELVAVPTASGATCYALLLHLSFNPNCVEQLDNEMPTTVDFISTRGTNAVSGIAIDSVNKVEIELSDGSRELAKIGSNGWIWFGPKQKLPFTVEVTLANGAKISQPVFPDGVPDVSAF